jgi:hypothetical protein
VFHRLVLLNTFLAYNILNLQQPLLHV